MTNASILTLLLLRVLKCPIYNHDMSDQISLHVHMYQKLWLCGEYPIQICNSCRVVNWMRCIASVGFFFLSYTCLAWRAWSAGVPVPFKTTNIKTDRLEQSKNLVYASTIQKHICRVIPSETWSTLSGNVWGFQVKYVSVDVIFAKGPLCKIQNSKLLCDVLTLY